MFKFILGLITHLDSIIEFYLARNTVYVVRALVDAHGAGEIEAFLVNLGHTRISADS